MALGWEADDGIFWWYLDSIPQSSEKSVSVGPLLTKLSGSAYTVTPSLLSLESIGNIHLDFHLKNNWNDNSQTLPLGSCAYPFWILRPYLDGGNFGFSWG